MEETPKPAEISDVLDLVLRKYGKIWIWSILLTIAATYFLRSAGALGVMQLNVRGAIGPNGMGAGAFVWIYFASGFIEAFATLLSLYWLCQFMVSELLPIFFEVQENPNFPDGAQLLYRAFGGILVSLGSQLAAYALALAWGLRG